MYDLGCLLEVKRQKCCFCGCVVYSLLLPTTVTIEKSKKKVNVFLN